MNHFRFGEGEGESWGEGGKEAGLFWSMDKRSRIKVSRGLEKN